MKINHCLQAALFLAIVFCPLVTAGSEREAPFNSNVLCKLAGPGDASTRVEISYDPSTHQDFGRVGTISVKLNTGISGLSTLGRRLGMQKPFQSDHDF